MTKFFYLILFSLLPISSYCNNHEKLIIINNEIPQTRGGEVLLDYLKVISNELYVCSENNTSGICYYTVYREGVMMMKGQVSLSACSQTKIEVKSLPKGSYTIEVETPTNFISTDMDILERFYLME